MRSLVALLCLFALVAARPNEQRNLHGAQVLRTVPHKAAQVHYLHGLLRQGLYDFWKEPSAVGRPVDIMATAFELPVLKAVLDQLELKYSTMIPDLMKLTREEQKARAQAPKAMDWTSYHDYDEIMSWLEGLAASDSDVASVEDVGTTYEGRTMKMLTIGTGPATNPGIFIDGGIHAREWISPATVTYMVNELISKKTQYADILSAVNFYVMPVINPDGYAYTFTDDRFWRKTRTDYGLCKGADPNRNWDFHWGEAGTSNQPCSDIYMGPTPFSELSQQNVRDQITKLVASNNLMAYLTFHAYSQLWMYPWGWTSALPDDWQELDDLAQDAVSALTAVYGTRYEIGSSTNTIYAAAGGSDDWAKGGAGVKYAYTIELRDTGNWGFALPAEQIIPSGEETFEALLVYANYFKNGGT